MVVKDRFRDWNLYHKSIVVAIGTAIVWIIAWAIIVYDNAFEFTHEETLPYSPAAIWPVIVADENRPRWAAELVDIGRLSGVAGEQDTTRLLFWRQDFKRWQAVERISSVLPERLLKSVQEADKDHRWVTIELVPEGNCQTKVILTEVILPLDYNDRFWFFRKTEQHEKRLATSHRALKRWVEDLNPVCEE